MHGNQLSYFSLFSGTGGFELGIGERGNCVGYSEIDRHALSVYQRHFPAHINYGDVRKICEATLPKFDLLAGGFPCQAFSIAGHRRGFHDSRGSLFFDIVRIVRQKQPRLLLLENVKVLLSHGNGETFRTIITALDELGYGLQWQVLNSKNHGVPQNRERVFIVGHSRGTPRPQVFPFGEINGGNLQEITQGVGDAQRICSIEGVAKTLKGLGGGQGAKTGLYAIDDQVRGKNYGTRIRRLTPKECERLQGFPDDWTGGLSDNQRYKCLGNAVTVNVIEGIASRLLP